jgi:hypothetical protein
MGNRVRIQNSTVDRTGAGPVLPSIPAAGAMELDFLRPVIESGKWGADNTGGLPIEGNLAPVPVIADALGVEQARMAAEFAGFQGLEHAVPVCTGTRALVIALTAASLLAEQTGKRALAPGKKVLVAGLTWQATALAPIERNLAPILLDVPLSSGVVAAEPLA